MDTADTRNPAWLLHGRTIIPKKKVVRVMQDGLSMNRIIGRWPRLNFARLLSEVSENEGGGPRDVWGLGFRISRVGNSVGNALSDALLIARACRSLLLGSVRSVVSENWRCMQFES